MRNTFSLVFLLTLIVSCSRESQFPEYLTRKVSSEKLIVAGIDSIRIKQEKEVSLKNSKLPGCLEQLSTSVLYFKNKDQNFSFKKFKQIWAECKNELSGFDKEELVLDKWVESTGLLLQLTADAQYAEELERIFLETTSNVIRNKVARYVITKNVDHLHVNLFIPAKIEYEHSLRGKITMLMETSYPEKGKVGLTFNSEIKRYVELFIRIPSWAKGAHVIAGGVKYLAPAGEYCKIARQWREGDSVKVIFNIKD